MTSSRSIILVTSANQGLGHEALKALARENKYHIVNPTCSQSKADEAVKVITSKTSSDPTNFTPVVINLHNQKFIFTAAAIVKEKFGHLDILVNSTGINRSPTNNATLRENLRAVFETNVFVAVMNEAFLSMIRAQRCIVTVTSGLGMFGKYEAPVYHSSKSAVNMLAAVDTIMLQDENFPTVLVEPGYCRTAFGGFHGDKDANKGGLVIARAAVEGDNKDLFLKIGDGGGKHAEFGWQCIRALCPCL
ncbi:hypothetical protein BJX76DRAFT_366486 [Aspergillus varians]